VRIAKNTILKRAIEGDSRWDVVGEKLESSNMWFFVGSDLKVGREGGREEREEREGREQDSF
jgi:ribosomal protein L10